MTLFCCSVLRVSDPAPDMTDERFAANLKAARERAGLSQRQLAERMAEAGHPMPQQTINRIESGTRKVRGVGEARSLAQALGTTVDILSLPRGAALDALHLTQGARRLREAASAARAARGRYDFERQLLARVTEKLAASDLAAQLREEIGIARRALEREDQEG